MSNTTFIRFSAAVTIVGFVIAVTSFALQIIWLGLIGSMVFIAGAVGVTLFLQRRLSHSLASGFRRITARLDELAVIKEQVAAVAGSVDALRDEVGSLTRAVSRHQGSGSSGSTVDGSPGSAAQHALLGRDDDVALSHPLARGGHAEEVLTLGRPLNEVSIGGRATRALLPGRIPSSATISHKTTLVVDEAGFSQGVWRGLGAELDGFIVEQLAILRRLVADNAIEVYTLMDDSTPNHLSGTRSWGHVINSVEDFVDARSAV